MQLSDSSGSTDGDVLARIRRVAVSLFRCHTEPFNADTTADDIDGWDSLSHTVFLLGLEREFGVRFDIGRVAHLTKMGDMADEIARLVS